MIALLMNENIPDASFLWLLEQGYDVKAISNEMPGAKDEVVLAFAQKERRIIVTFDRDYGELIYHRNLPVPAGLIYLRLIPATPNETGYIVHELLIRQDLHCENIFTVVGRDHIRQRPLIYTQNGSISDIIAPVFFHHAALKNHPIVDYAQIC